MELFAKNLENGVYEIPCGRTCIYACEFQNNPEIRGIIMPPSVTKIEHHAFAGCVSLGKVELSPNLKSIEQGAFAGCRSLEEAAIPHGVKVIEREVFKGCSKLEAVTFSDTLTEIRDGAFENCEELYTIGCTSPQNDLDNDLDFSYFVNLGEAPFPRSLQKIGPCAFKGCKALESIEINNPETTISFRAFYGCINLRRITAPKGLKNIGLSAFESTGVKPDKNGFVIVGGCLLDFVGGNKIIRIPEGVRRIGSMMLPFCAEEIFIPASVEYADYQSFKYTKWYENFPKRLGFFIVGDNVLMKYVSDDPCVDIPYGVKRIGKRAFDGEIEIKHFERLEIPSSVREIDPDAFLGARFETVSLFGMEFDNRYLPDIPRTVSLARNFDDSCAIPVPLKLAAALENFFGKFGKNWRAEELLQNRPVEAAKLLIDNKQFDRLRLFVESELFLNTENDFDEVIELANQIPDDELAEYLETRKAEFVNLDGE